VLLVGRVGNGRRIERDGTGFSRTNALVVWQELLVVGRQVVVGLSKFEDVCGVTWVSAVIGVGVAADDVLSRTNLVYVGNFVLALYSRPV